MPAKRAAKKAPAKKAPAKRATKKAPAKKQPAKAPAVKARNQLALKYAHALQKKFGENAAVTLEQEKKAASEITERISTGVDVLDWYVLGNGGLPIGRISETFGDEGCGKTTLAYSAAAEVQKAGGIAAWIDGECAFDASRAETFGVNPDTILIVQPQSLEQLFNQMRMVLSLHNPQSGQLLLIWDSIAAMTTDSGLRKDAGERKVGDVPLIMSEELKKVAPMLPKHRTHLMMINQVRANIGVMFGDKTTTPGGKAPKFYSSQRLQIFGGKSVKNSKGEHIAKVVTYLGVKNRLNFPFLKAKVRLDFSSGYNNIWSTIWHAKRMKLIKCRAEGFSGPSREGLEVYRESIEALEWPLRGDLSAARESDEDDLDFDVEGEDTDDDEEVEEEEDEEDGDD